MHWFRFLTHPRQYRQRRAYFRPADTSDLNAASAALTDHILTVRFADVAGTNSPRAGQRLYAMRGVGLSALTCVRPEGDFDFLD